MAATTCPNCAQEISDAASICPGCGRSTLFESETQADKYWPHASAIEHVFQMPVGYNRRLPSMRITDAISKLARDVDWSVTIGRRLSELSVDRNQIFCALVCDIAAQIGGTPARVEEDLKTLLGVRIAINGVDGNLREINKPIGEYEAEELTDFIVRIIELCEGADIDIDNYKAIRVSS